VLVYDTTFNSNIIGEFTDTGRELRLVLDEQQQAWRVAWSPGNIFAEMANGGRLRMETVIPTRASIYDRNGEILADSNGQIVLVSIIRGEIPDMPNCINTLARSLNQAVESVEARMATFGMEQLAQVGQMEQAGFQQWRTALELNCAAQFDNRPVRRYLNGDLAPHIIGYVGYPDESQLEALEWEGFRRDSIVGRSGIEATWNSTLAGKPGGRLTIVSPNGLELRFLGQKGTEPGQSIYLTIDANLQRHAASMLAEAYAAAPWGQTSPGGSAIVYDPNTGAVLAMVSYPTFNANAFNSFPVMGLQAAQEIVQQVQNDERRPQLNRPTQGGYPSGSTMKIMTAIAALDSGVFGFDERFVSVGIWDKDIPRRDWLAGGHGSQTIQGALTVSCNTCFYEAGYRLDNLDPYLLPSYASRLGLGRLTGINEFIAESPGVIGNPDTKSQFAPDEGGWRFSDAVNMAIGQGFVEVTPLQMVRMYSAVLTDGTLYRPQLVARTGLLDQTDYTMTPDAMSNIDIDEEILSYVRTGLCDVTVKTWGTAEFVFRRSRLQELGVCGKTGTAQDPLQRESHAWFVGFAPRENPEVAVIVMIENSGEGSEVAAPLVRDLMEYYFYELEP
jgi:penicillin-binding protein 2